MILRKNAFILIIISLLFLSCVTTGNDSENQNSTPSENKLIEVEGESLPAWIFDSSPSPGNGNIRFVTFALRKADRDEEIVRAKQLAAMEASKYYGLYVSVKELSQQGNRNFGFAENIEFKYNEERAPDYMDDLELEKKLQTRNGTYARFRLKNSHAPINFKISNPEKPEWLVNMPDIPGYQTSLGMVQRHRNFYTSMVAADEDAIKELAYSKFGKMDNQSERVSKTTTTTNRSASLETILMQGEGVLKNIVCLARWQDENGNFYSLIAVPEK